MVKEQYARLIKDVSGGPGGMATLILGSEKTVLHDVGMACFHRELEENLTRELGGRPLDYIVLSHTHYDHVGALPYILVSYTHLFRRFTALPLPPCSFLISAPKSSR